MLNFYFLKSEASSRLLFLHVHAFQIFDLVTPRNLIAPFLFYFASIQHADVHPIRVDVEWDYLYFVLVD